MVTSTIDCGDCALQPCQRVFQDRNPVFSRNVVGDRAIGPACCKVLADAFLVLRENVDRELPVLEATETVIQTDQDEDWLQ